MARNDKSQKPILATGGDGRPGMIGRVASHHPASADVA